jgi:hypothetical protein
VPDIFLYAGEANPNDIKLSDPTVLRSGGGPTIIETEGSSIGLSVATGNAAAIWNSLGSSDGLATVTGASAAIWAGVGSSAGLAVPTGLAAAIWDSVGSSDGVAVCLADSETVLAGPPPAGTVPVRYIIGETANVVPVVTVFVWDFGVVSVREFVGPANVVPVREVTTETPHVKVLKV